MVLTNRKNDGLCSELDLDSAADLLYSTPNASRYSSWAQMLEMPEEKEEEAKEMAKKFFKIFMKEAALEMIDFSARLNLLAYTRRFSFLELRFMPQSFGSILKSGRKAFCYFYGSYFVKRNYHKLLIDYVPVVKFDIELQRHLNKKIKNGTIYPIHTL
jgi:hypothetical protein